MKTVLALLGVAMLLADTVFAQADIIIKKHAMELRDQNNVRQGVSTAQPGCPARPTATAPEDCPHPGPAEHRQIARRAYCHQGELQVTTDQKQKIATDLIAVAQGASKPSNSTAANLANSLAGAFAVKPLPDRDCSRLLSDLAAVLNPAKIQATQMQAIYADIQAIFQANGMARKDAMEIVNQVKAIAAETQRPAS